MFDGLNHVSDAVEILLTSNEPLPGRLRKAMAEFFVAYVTKDEWPEDVWQMADKLDKDFAKAEVQGSVEAEANRLAHELWYIHDSIRLALFEAHLRETGQLRKVP